MVKLSSSTTASEMAGAAAMPPPTAISLGERKPKCAVPMDEGSEERPDPSDAMARGLSQLRLITCQLPISSCRISKLLGRPRADAPDFPLEFEKHDCGEQSVARSLKQPEKHK